MPCGYSRKKQDEEAAGAVIRPKAWGRARRKHEWREEVSKLLWDLGQVRHRQCLELQGEQGHQAPQRALLGMGAQGLVLPVPEELQRQRRPRRGQKVLQAGDGEEPQGQGVLLLLDM